MRQIQLWSINSQEMEPSIICRLTDVNRQASLWTMLFTDDTMICSQHWEQVEENLEMCYYALLRSGMKVNRSNTCVNNRETRVTVKMQRVEDVKVADKIRNNTSELRLSGFQRQGFGEYRGQKMLKMGLPCRRIGGQKADMQRVGVPVIQVLI